MTSRAFTLIEVLVAIAILAILGVSIVAFLPMLTQNTQVASLDARQSQQAISVFERTAAAWSNGGAWKDGEVENTPLHNLVQSEMGSDCRADVTSPTTVRKRVVITCDREGASPLILRAEFGDPNA